MQKEAFRGPPGPVPDRVHMGDVIVRAGDLFGDGVNIAARLQALAGPGGVCISGEAHRCVRRILPWPTPTSGNGPSGTSRIRSGSSRSGRRPGVGMSSDTMPLSLPDKPSIAVLPFATMGGPDQDYLRMESAKRSPRPCPGFTASSSSPAPLAFTYKADPSNVQQVSRELGVRYVLE